jgi:aminomethyltransferase
MNISDTPNLQMTALSELHLELGARMVPFAGYAMPVQYPIGLMAEHRHTRESASLFDISHMSQIRITGEQCCTLLERLIPMDVLGLDIGKQRYGLLLNDAGGIIDDLMFFKQANDNLFIIVNGACREKDLAYMQDKIGSLCTITSLPDQALLALQGPKAAQVLSSFNSDITKLVFMEGGDFSLNCENQVIPVFLTRSGYTGEDGFEISVHKSNAVALAKALLTQDEVKPAGLGSRNSLRLEAGLCLYGNDLDEQTNPVEAGLLWSIQKIRRNNGLRSGGFPGADKLLLQIDDQIQIGAQAGQRRRVGLIAKERIPVRENTELQNLDGLKVGLVTSGLLSPILNDPIAMGYVDGASAQIGTLLHAIVRGKPVVMEVCRMPFVVTRYYRG